MHERLAIQCNPCVVALCMMWRGHVMECTYSRWLTRVEWFAADSCRRACVEMFFGRSRLPEQLKVVDQSRLRRGSHTYRNFSSLVGLVGGRWMQSPLFIFIIAKVCMLSVCKCFFIITVIYGTIQRKNCVQSFILHSNIWISDFWAQIILDES